MFGILFSLALTVRKFKCLEYKRPALSGEENSVRRNPYQVHREQKPKMKTLVKTTQ